MNRYVAILTATITTIFTCVLLWMLAGLPGIVAHLGVAAQVRFYGARLRLLPVPLRSMRGAISSHGLSAVPELVAEVTGEKSELPRAEAIEILWEIQVRGCDLEGTSAVAALERLLTTEGGNSVDADAAAHCLLAIREHRRYPPRAYDGLPSPCESVKSKVPF
jgi:hypothetical protein